MGPRFGPVDVLAIGFPQPRVPDAVREAILAALDSGAVTLLDLVVMRRAESGELEILELDVIGDELGIADLALSRPGLTGQEDMDEIAASLAPGTTALVLVLEHTWARDLVATASDAGAGVLMNVRIPALVVAAVAELVEAG